MKACKECGVVKPLGDFHRRKVMKDGRRRRCKPCVNAYMREYYKNNAEEKRQWQRDYRRRNADRVRAYDRFRYKRDNLKHLMRRRRYYRKNRKEILEKSKEYYYTKRDFEKAREAQRRHYENHKERYEIWRMEKKQRVPVWFSELDQFVSDQACDLREMRNECTGIEWHIDHIIPLKGKKVSGLHVWNNLQVIPAVENLRKGNSYELEAA